MSEENVQKNNKVKSKIMKNKKEMENYCKKQKNKNKRKEKERNTESNE